MKKILPVLLVISTAFAISPCRFHDVCEHGSYAEIRNSLNPDVNVNAPDPIGRTPLTIAVETGKDTAVVALLLAAGADIDMSDAQGNTPLILAAKNSDPVLCRYLKDHHADVTVKNHDNKSYSDYIKKGSATAKPCDF